MKPSIVSSSAVFAALMVIGTPSMAHHELERSGAEAIPLKGGATLWVFKDRKMAVEDKFGRAQAYKIGRSFEAVDGRLITATSSESARLRSLMRKGHKGGS